MILGTMVPIPKNKQKSLCNLDNYRVIAIIGQIPDWVILFKDRHVQNGSNLQFSFKNNLSITQCTFCMIETVNYYNFNRSDVYVLLLDAIKAFDQVKYYKLFRDSSNRHMSSLVIRLLMYMYTNQRLRVRWGNEMSSQFDIGNGVKQGGVLSPHLFEVYIDGLSLGLRLVSHGHLLHWHTCFADDLNLLFYYNKDPGDLFYYSIVWCRVYNRDMRHRSSYNGSKSQGKNKMYKT